MTKAQIEADKIVKKIAKHCRPEKIYLFGSVSDGSEHPYSDIDLLIVKESDKKRPFRTKEIFEALRGVDREYSVDPIVYTQKEIDERVAMGDFFVKEVIDNGRLVYGQ